MKKLWITLITILVLFIVGCEENFSPKGDFEEKFALTCIVRGDTSLQIASIFSSYDVEGYDASVNDVNSAYRNADIRLWYQDTVYVFKDSVVSNNNLPDSTFYFYYLDNFKPGAKGELLEIEATLTNGKRLNSSCYTPARMSFDTQETTSTIPAVNTSTVNVMWKSEDVNNFYVGKIKVKYYELINGENIEKWLELPATLVENDGEQIPLYPTPTRQYSIAFSQAAINYALKSISNGNENKSDYTISNVGYIEVLSLDENLSRYYSSTLEDNQYTVRVNEIDFSNVEGGFGVFGALQKETKTITVQPAYIETFGYKVLYEN